MALGVTQRAVFDRLEEALRNHVGGIPSIVPSAPDDDDKAAPSLCPEIDCVRALLTDGAAAEAERHAMSIGVGADRVLVTSGTLSDEAYLRTLAATFAVEFETLADTPRELCPLADDRLIEAAAAGMLPLTIDGELNLVVAPRGIAVRRIIDLIGANPSLARRFRFTTAERLQRYVFQHGAHAIGQRAAQALHTAWPSLSAGPPRWRSSLVPAFILCTIAFGIFAMVPGPAMLALEIFLATVFLAWMILRIAGTFVDWPAHAKTARLRDRELPVYTIMVALYREVAAIQGLVAALKILDYPREKLDIKLIVEPDDTETTEALKRLELGPPFEIIVAPDFGPRTKPKALNAALSFARGTFTVIFDAEDRPEPDQLRRALDAFLFHGDELACVQACLTIDNTADNWLTGLFTAEYAGQFDVFLPALAALKMPLPLGGSSNHFRTATLRAVGAWDPYNVTEDADLGIRLARFGFRTSVIESATYEEAPARFGAWLRQRTRWFKGWMQTWLVHMREPRRLMRELGVPGFLTFQLMVGGNVLAALVHPLFMIWFFSGLASDEPMWKSQGMAALFGFTVVVGYLTSALLGAVGLFRRRLMATSWVLLFMPVHWLLLALAAWRALYQLVREPYRWEKTEHGFARTSRTAQQAAARQAAAHNVIAEIFGRASERGAITNDAADPPPRPQAAA